MKKMFWGILAGMALCAISHAQEATPSPIPPPTNNAASHSESVSAAGDLRIAPGSIIPVQLTKSIDAKKVKKGDPVEAKVIQDLKTNTGQLVVPKDTKVMGQVTEAQAANKDQKESQVGITFDHMVLKNGSEAAVPMSIQAVIAPWNLNAGNNNKNNATAERSNPMPAGSDNAGMSQGARSSTGQGAAPSAEPPPPSPSNVPASAQNGTDVHQPITGKTQGVVGISNLDLSTGADLAQGSLLRSEKGSVKLDSGTWMLLRVVPSNP